MKKKPNFQFFREINYARNNIDIKCLHAIIIYYYR